MRSPAGGSGKVDAHQFRAIVEFLTALESPEFQAGHVEAPRMIGPGEFTMPFIDYGETAGRFVQTAYDGGLVLTGFDWPQWAQSAEAANLRDDEHALARATPEQLAKLLTVIIRQDRFCEGTLLDAFEQGLILRVVRRAVAILQDEEAEPACRQPSGTMNEAPDPGLIGSILARAKEVAIDYYRATGRPLGVTGEVGEYEATRLLGLKLADARAPGYDAIDGSGHRYQIKARALSDAGRRRSQQIGSIKLDHDWDSVLLVIMDECLDTLGIWQAERSRVSEALRAPGGRGRNERGALSISKFKQIGHQVWPDSGSDSDS